MAVPLAFALVVIPDLDERLFVGATLMMAGLRVKGTGSFKRARSVLLAYPPSVLDTDIRPRRTKGLDLARLGRSLIPHMTQLVTSDSNDPGLRRDIEALGATLLQTPVTESQLLAALYRTMFREPNADGTVGPAGPPLFRSNTKPRETFPFTPVWAPPLS